MAFLVAALLVCNTMMTGSATEPGICQDCSDARGASMLQSHAKPSLLQRADKAEDEGRLLMIVAASGETVRANSDGRNLRTILSGNTPCSELEGTAAHEDALQFSRANGLAVDEESGYVFWSVWTGTSPVINYKDIQNNVNGSYPDITQDAEFQSDGNERWSLDATLWRGDLSGSTAWPIITHGEVMRFTEFNPNTGKVHAEKRPDWADWPRQIALQNPATVEVDPIGKRVFWAEMPVQPPHWLASSSYDGFDMTTHVYACDMGAGINSGRFRVDGVHKKLYWLDRHDVYWHIMRANYDGSARESVVRFEFPPMSFILDVEEDLIYVAADGTTTTPPGIYKTGLSGRRRSTKDQGACHRDNVKDDCKYVLRIPVNNEAKQTYDGQVVPDDKVYTPNDLVLDKKNHAIFWTGYIHVDTFPAKTYRTCLYDAEQPPKKPEDFASGDESVYGDITVVQRGTFYKEIDLLNEASDSSTSLPECSPPGSIDESSSCVDIYEICPEVAKRPWSWYSWKDANCGQPIYNKACCASCAAIMPEEDEDDTQPLVCAFLTDVGGRWLPPNGTVLHSWKDEGSASEMVDNTTTTTTTTGTTATTAATTTAATTTTEDSCSDKDGFVDALGYACSSWDWPWYNCRKAQITWGFSRKQQKELLKNCPKSCGTC